MENFDLENAISNIDYDGILTNFRNRKEDNNALFVAESVKEKLVISYHIHTRDENKIYSHQYDNYNKIFYHILKNPNILIPSLPIFNYDKRTYSVDHHTYPTIESVLDFLIKINKKTFVYQIIQQDEHQNFVVKSCVYTPIKIKKVGKSIIIDNYKAVKALIISQN